MEVNFLPQQTVAAISTPPGVGALAVIRVSGPACYQVAKAVFRPKNKKKSLENVRGYTALYGDFVQGESKIDDGIALFFRAPHSYTGEDAVDFSCHGGAAVTTALLEACLHAGAVPAPPGEFTRRAVLSGRMSLTQAEAVMDVVSAASRRGAQAARAALDGALAREIAEMREALVALAAHLAAWTDYPEEDVEELPTQQFDAVVTRALAQLERMIDRFDTGLLLRRGVDTVIVGSPNVGKSTLFNLLTGYNRAIVTPVAGTTRDVLREQVQLGGVALNLSDTAGLHNSDDLVEREGIRRSLAEMEKAQLILAVFDASSPLGEAELDLARSCAGRRALAIVNKSDLGMAFAATELKPFFKKLVVVSAAPQAASPEAKNIQEDDEINAIKIIENAVEELLHLDEVDESAAMLANQRQLTSAIAARDALRDAHNALTAGLALDAAGVCLEDSIRALAALMGEDATDMILEQVFASFCVGK